jgi:hypothetical protein
VERLEPAVDGDDDAEGVEVDSLDMLENDKVDQEVLQSVLELEGDVDQPCKRSYFSSSAVL